MYDIEVSNQLVFKFLIYFFTWLREKATFIPREKFILFERGAENKQPVACPPEETQLHQNKKLEKQMENFQPVSATSERRPTDGFLQPRWGKSWTVLSTQPPDPAREVNSQGENV